MAARFWVGGTGNFSDTAHWAATSGGAGGQTVPVAGDTVTIDANSGGGTITFDQAVSVVSIIASAALSGTILNLSASVITLSGTGTVWSTNTNNVTIVPGTSAITSTGTNVTFAMGNGQALNDLTFSGAGLVQFGGGVGPYTFNNLTRTGTAIRGEGLQLTVGATFIVTGTFTATGNSLVNRLRVAASVPTLQATINAAAVSLTNVDFMSVVGAGTAAPFTGTSLGDLGATSGITFTTAVTRFWVGNGGNFSDTAHWSATSGGASGASVPLTQDTIVFDANSITAAAQTVVNDIVDVGGVDFTNVLNTPTFNIAGSTIAHNYYRSVILTGIGTFAQSRNVNFRGTTPATLTMNGKTFVESIVFLPHTSGGWTLGGNLLTATTRAVQHLGGSLNTNGFTVDVGIFQVSGSNNPKILTLGSSTIIVRDSSGSVLLLNNDGNLLTIPANTAIFQINNTSASTKVIGASPAAASFNSAGTRTHTDVNGATIQIVNAGTGGITINGRIHGANWIFPSGASVPLILNDAIAQDSPFAGIAGRGNTFRSSTPGSAATITNSTHTIRFNHLAVSDITTGGTSTFEAQDSVNVSGNTGITFRKSKKLAMAGVGGPA